MKLKRILSSALLLLFLGTAFGTPIVHHKVSSAPASPDPTLIGGPDWNAGHDINATDLLGALGINVVSADPNGTSATSGKLAWDQTHAQLWINSDGATTWTSFVRSDGGSAAPATAFAFFGDSGTNSQGVNTDNAVAWNHVISGTSPVPYANVVLNTTYATASSEPLTMVDVGTTDLRVLNVGSPPGYGWEFSFGLSMYDILNGIGAAPTVFNKPWLIKMGISGVELKQLLPASSYGTGTPAFGGLNAYTYFRNRTQALLAASGRRLGGIVFGSLGGNDAANSPDANAVAANMATLAAQVRADFGSQVAIVWLKLSATADTGVIPFRDTVRAQMVTGAATIPNCRLLIIDSYPMLSDHLHWGADPVWDMGLQIAEAMRQMLGRPARVVAQPTLIGYGTPDYNKASSTLSPRGYPLSRDRDFELLFVEAVKLSGSGTAISTPAGWTSQGNTSNVASGETIEFALFSRPLVQADLDANNGLPPPVTITTGNDENAAVRLTIRDTSGLDGSAVSYSSSFGTGSVNAGGTTTTAPNDLVVTLVGGEGGGASPTISYTVSNATTGAAVLIAAPLVQNTSNFNLLAVITGIKVSAGASGTTVITPNITTNPSGFTVALKN